MTQLAKQQRRSDLACPQADHLPDAYQPSSAAPSARGLLEPLQVTIRQAAQLLRYDERTVRRLIARGTLRAVGTGRLRRIALTDLRDWQERNRC